MLPLAKMQMNTSKKKLLKHIFKHSEITRGDLVKATGLSNLTVTKLVAEMLEQSLIIEDGVISSSIGRRPNVLKINPEYKYVISVDIGYHEFRIGVVRFNGEILESRTILNSSSITPRKTVEFEDLCSIIGEYLKKYGSERFLGIGIGISGMVDPQKGKVVFCPNVSGYDNMELANQLGNRIGLPVYVDTTSRCNAIGEQYFGVGFNVSNQIFVSLGYGTIASGIIIGGKLFYGANGYAGEIGHNMVSGGNHVYCTCGRYDCLENYASLIIMLDNFSQKLMEKPDEVPIYVKNPGVVTPEEFRAALNAGQRDATEIFRSACQHIGEVIAPVINTLNPELVILGGALPVILPESVSLIENYTMRMTLMPAWKNVEIKRSSLGSDGPIIGGALQIISRYLDF